MQTEATALTAKRWTEEQARGLIHEIMTDLAPSPGALNPKGRLVEDLGYHSLALLELAFSLEDEFDLPTIDEPTARKILSVGDVEQHVIANLRASQRLIEE